MADVTLLPTAATQPVINPKVKGRRARSGKVTLACDLVRRRYQRKFAHVVTSNSQAQAQQDMADERLASKVAAAAFIAHVITQLPDQASVDRLLDVIAKAGAQALREQSAGLQR